MEYRTLQTTESLQKTPFYANHLSLNARMAEFGGWLMPIQYEGITAEHQAVRQRSGLFDISHMGKFRLQGPDVLGALETLVPSSLSGLQPGQAKYTVLLNADGGIIDDLIIYHQGQDAAGTSHVVIIVNASTTAKDLAWLTAQLAPAKVQLADESERYALLAIQGPQAIAQLQTLTAADLTTIPIYWHRDITLMDQPAWVARTGYTGEDGFEIMVAPETGIALWTQLLALGVEPCGLGARDTLRLEAAMALYGQDIDDTISPLEAGLSWLVQWDKPTFIGREALLGQKNNGLTRCLVGLEMQGRHIARHNYDILYEGQTVGIVTSGSFTPALGKAIALGYVPPNLAQPGQVLSVSIRGKACPAKVVKRPFYRRPKQTP